jgi:hypothetical protein
MDLFIRRPAEFDQLYNCSFYNVSAIPLEKRQHISLGFAFVTLGIIEEVHLGFIIMIQFKYFISSR